MKLLGSNVCVICGIAVLCASARSQITTRVSVDSAGVQGNASCDEFAAISGDGRYVAFASAADNLVPGDTNGIADVFVRDRATSITQRISSSSAGAEADDWSYFPLLSADGRFVAFSSTATNLVPGDTNGVFDVFVHDRQAGLTERASVSSTGAQAGIDAWLTGLSADGRFVAFYSESVNLVAGDTNGLGDMFVHDRQTGVTERVNVGPAGAQANDSTAWECGLSADGRYVTFSSWATNLVSGDTNGVADIFVRDRLTGVTQRVSVNSSSAQANDSSYFASTSADGRFVAFFSYASNLVPTSTNGFPGMFVRDRTNGVTELVSVSSAGVPANGDGYAFGLALSGNGRFVTFMSYSDNLVPGDTNGDCDIFLRDRQLGITERVNVDSSGAQANIVGFSQSPMSFDGRFVAFTTYADNLVPGDTGGFLDAFVRDRGPSSPDGANYCTAKVNSAGCTPAITSSGNPSATAGSGFFVNAEQVLPNESGILFYSVHGSAGWPFQGGFLCATPPTWRTPLQTSSSGGAPPCTGLYTFDFNARIAGGIDPALVVGQHVWSQYWMRDPGAPSTTGLTNGLTFVIGQ